MASPPHYLFTLRMKCEIKDFVNGSIAHMYVSIPPHFILSSEFKQEKTIQTVAIVLESTYMQFQIARNKYSTFRKVILGGNVLSLGCEETSFKLNILRKLTPRKRYIAFQVSACIPTTHNTLQFIHIEYNLYSRADYKRELCVYGTST